MGLKAILMSQESGSVTVFLLNYLVWILITQY